MIMSVAELQQSIEFDNSGPIKGTFKIDLDGPGLYELNGSKGTGKTTVLNAIAMLAGHKVQLTVHDGELSGKVEGFGVVVPLGSKKRPRGECELDTLDSEKFDLIDLIDPDGKTPETRDSVRIKALSSITNLSLKPADFYHLTGGQKSFDELAIKETDDPVLYASRVKAAIDNLAKLKEEYAKTEKGHAKGLEERVGDVDLTGEDDARVLADAVDQATSHLSSLLEQSKHAEQLAHAAGEARERLEEARESYQGPSVQAAKLSLNARHSDVELAQDQVDMLTRALADAKEELATAGGKFAEAQETLMRAEQHDEDIRRWEETLAQSDFVAPTIDQIEEARTAKEVARRDQEQGVRIRDAKQAAQSAKVHKQAAIGAMSDADQYRAAAGQVFDVLTTKLQTKVIRVESVAGSPRLVVKHPKRGKCLFDQDNGLSDGERVKAVIDELLPHLKSPGLFEIPQRIYQDLPPADRKELAAYGKKKKVFIFGAQVTDGELAVKKVV
jgi:energy-coupling factor transporter ATP-binding protein EcfA2